MQTLRMAKRLMEICQSDADEFRPSQQLDHFCREFSVGQRVGAMWRITLADKVRIAKIVRSELKVDPTASPQQWSDISRHEAMSLGGNEKLSRKRLRGERVAVKSLPGRPLMLNACRMELPPGACLDLDWFWVAEHCEHENVLLVENWESFELTHQTPFLRTVSGNPLVVFRGAPGSYRVDSAYKLLEALARPVLAFTDYDPEGVAIAATLPHFSTYLAPSNAVLERLMKQVSTHDRYIRQLVGKIEMLDALTDTDLARVYQVIRKEARALPQEKLIGLELGGDAADMF